MDATEDLSAVDDKTVRFRLKRPFPHLPEALAGPGGNAPVIMPERLAQESPFKPVSEIIPIKDYEELLERIEDAEDVAWLKRARRKPLHYRPLEQYLAERNRK